MTCPACAATNVDTAKFCVECGAPQTAASCTGCGSALTGGRFCPECGTPTTPGVAAPPLPERTAERRRTSVLFGDLVGFTTLSETRDPEEVRELLSRYFDEARTVVQRYGGTVEKFIGDAVMAVWGVPVAHEDDAERAVRAGIDLLATVATLGEDVGMPGLALRVGVVTGEVAVTLGATGEGMVAGDAVNTAARVQSAASPGTVWVDDATRLLTSAAVTYSDAGEHALKGKSEPMRLYQARAVVAAVGGAQRVDGLEAPFVGRERDLRLVKELFHATHEEGRPRLVTVTGVAGVGKSRLGWEFEKYIDGLTVLTRWHRGRCLSYGEGVAFWAFAEMVRSRLEVTEGDSREESERKLAVGLERWIPDPEERAWIGPRLAVLLGHGEGSSYDRTDLFAGWTLFLERVGEGLPLILVFEDLHHGDTGLLDLVEHLVETARFPLFVLALTRPELLDRRPAVATGRRTTPLYLEPLGDAAMGSLVDGLVDGLPDAARTALVARAEGVPLYAVETVRSLIDRDIVVPREGRYVFVEDAARVDLATLAAPASLQTLIAARLDALTPEQRRTVQDASVLGLSFTTEALRALSAPGVDVESVLEGLLRKEILELQGDPRSPERGQYRFLQALVRQVAYDTLSRRDRKSRHLAVAAHLAEALDDADDLAAVLAQHHLDALASSSSDDTDGDALAARARELLARAAARAEALGSPEQALRHAERALDCSPSGLETAALQELASRNARAIGAADRALELAREAKGTYTAAGLELDAARALLLEAEALRAQGLLQQAVDLMSPAYDALSHRPDAQVPLLKLAGSLSGAHVFLGNHDAAERYGLRALQLAEAEGDAAEIAGALYRFSLVMVYLGSPSAGRALLLESIRVARSDSLNETLAMALNNLASMTYPWDLAEARPYAEEALALTIQGGDHGRTTIAMINVSLVNWLGGTWDRVDALCADWSADDFGGSLYAGLELISCCIAWARGEPIPPPIDYGDVNDVYDSSAILGVRALALAHAGDLDEAAVLAERGLREYQGSSYGFQDDLVLFWALALDLALAAGHTTRARQLLDLGASAPRDATTALLTSHAALFEGLLAAATGADPEAALADAIRQLDAYGAGYRLAQARLALGAWLAEQGRTQEAEPLLDAAGRTFADLQAGPMLAALSRARQLTDA